MGAALSAMRLRQQPQQAPQIDWSNPITQGLAFAFSNGSAAQGFCVGGQVVAPYTGAAGVLTPIGTGAKSTTTASVAYQVNATRIVGTNYSLFAAGSSASNAVTQSAIDDDATGVRKFQFRLANGKVEFIPFNTSGSVTGQPAFATALAVTDLVRGFTMGATASPVRTAAFQNGQLASSAPTNIASPSGDFAIGARKTAAQGWASGGLALVAGWSRTLSDAEMRSLAENPWQLFLAPSNTAQLAAAVGTFASASASVTASLSWTEADDAHAAIGRTTNRAAVAWSESDDGHGIAARTTDRAAVAWTEADDVNAAALRVTNGAAASWIEANDTTQIAAAAAAPATNIAALAAWTEADDTSALAAALRDRTLAAWVEADDTMAAALALRDAAALAWTEAADTMTFGVTVRAAAALAWAEEADVAHLALLVGAGITIDAALVPSARIVVFEGSRRVVLFEGGKRMVEFK